MRREDLDRWLEENYLDTNPPVEETEATEEQNAAEPAEAALLEPVARSTPLAQPLDAMAAAPSEPVRAPERPIPRPEPPQPRPHTEATQQHRPPMGRSGVVAGRPVPAIEQFIAILAEPASPEPPTPSARTEPPRPPVEEPRPVPEPPRTIQTDIVPQAPVPTMLEATAPQAVQLPELPIAESKVQQPLPSSRPEAPTEPAVTVAPAPDKPLSSPSDAAPARRTSADVPLETPPSVAEPSGTVAPTVPLATTAREEAAAEAPPRKRRGRPAKRVPPPEMAPPLTSEEFWALVPRHIRTLINMGQDEGVQRSYRRRFKESRLALIERLLDPTLSLEDTARLLNVCPATVRRYTNRGLLRHHRTKGDQRRFRLSDVLAFMEAQQSGEIEDRASR